MKTLSGIALLIILVVATNLQAQPYCGEVDVPGEFGPYDYTNAYDRSHLPIVERGHFTSNVRNLIKGETSSIAGDLGYVLRKFPNHHPALLLMSKLSFKEKTTHTKGARYPVECYFERAMRFKPGDAMVRMIYANHLLKLGGRQDEAMEQYHEAIRLEPENANINYNIGLIYLKEKDYEQAIVYAKKAYELDFPLPGLRNKLMKTGKWDGKLNEEVRDEAEGKVDEKIDVEPQK